MKLSARNQIAGEIIDVKKGATTAHVKIRISDGATITASITNEAVDELKLAPGQQVTYTVEVQAIQPGDARFRAELRSATLSKEVIGEESTTILPSAIPVPRVTPTPGPTAEPPVGGTPPAPGRQAP